MTLLDLAKVQQSRPETLKRLAPSDFQLAQPLQQKAAK